MFVSYRFNQKLEEWEALCASDSKDSVVRQTVDSAKLLEVRDICEKPDSVHGVMLDGTQFYATVFEQSFREVLDAGLALKLRHLEKKIDDLAARIGEKLDRGAAMEAEIAALDAKIEMVHERARTAAFFG
jgi:hypothetical protein